MSRSALVSHLENHLGLIKVGWNADADDTPMPFQVVRYVGSVAGGIAFSTLGLSRRELLSDISGRRFRQELLMIAPHEAADYVPALLQQVGLEAISGDRAFLRGRVLGPRGRLVPDTAMEALYTAMPVYLPEEFADTVDDSGNEILIPWLVPITHAEAHLVFEEGWRKFEDKLADEDPDLVQWSRPSMV
ncbi:hypothetical protein HDA40_005531 [Hamadaea flava]|uniref:Suppressor of fused domain protein n=1 Tax=Hamadaea flava TaxID=1742688 RepID=A0ABV8LXI2_9ACTN|nr:suppressor of fused domain protein [Hamadaea flava]MCP2327024.1 hypothetical protein [Hamadaea flava]